MKIVVYYGSLRERGRAKPRGERGDKKVQTKMKNPLDKIGKVWYNIRAVRESGER